MNLCLYIGLIFFQLFLVEPVGFERNSANSIENNSEVNHEEFTRLFSIYQLEGKIDYQVFKIAYKGYLQLKNKKSSYLTIVDYSKASTEKRLFVIDIQNQKLVYHTLVAHGKNSGLNFAKKFSNKSKSLMSSPGFYLTGETYYGKHGYSLRLDGVEKGINDNARSRAIVIHGASYVSTLFIKKHNRLGRSWGCPALPDELSKEIIDIIKEGSCLYIHTNDSQYLENSLIAGN